MVLLLLFQGAMLLRHSTWSAILALAMALVPAASATATERTLLFSPSDLAGVIDEFNADLLARSASLGKTLTAKGGIVKLAKKGCPSLAVDPLRRLTRVRVLDSAERAALLAGRRTPNLPLGAALASMGAVTWHSPASAYVGRPSWVAEPVEPGVLGFASVGYPNGLGTGAVDLASRTDTAAALLVRIDVDPTTPDPAEIVLAVTTEVPPRSLTGKWKRYECYVLARREAADAQVLVDIVAAAPLADLTRNRLNNILIDVIYWTQQGDQERVARNIRLFTIEVANRSEDEIPPATAEALLARSLLVTEALGF